MDLLSSVDEFVLDFDAEEAAQMRAQTAAVAAGPPIPISVSAADPGSTAVRPRRIIANSVGARIGLLQPTGRTGSPAPIPDRKGAPPTSGPATNGDVSNKLSELESLRRMIARLERQKTLEAARAAPAKQTVTRRQANGAAPPAPKALPTPSAATDPSGDNATAAIPGIGASSTVATLAAAALPAAAPARKRPRIAIPQAPALTSSTEAAAEAAAPRSASVPPIAATTAPSKATASTAPAALAAAAPLRSTTDIGTGSIEPVSASQLTPPSEASGSAAAPQQPRLIKRRHAPAQTRSESAHQQGEEHQSSPSQLANPPAVPSSPVGQVAARLVRPPLPGILQSVAASQQPISSAPQQVLAAAAMAVAAPAAGLNTVPNHAGNGAHTTASYGGGVGIAVSGTTPALTPPQCTTAAGGGSTTPQSKSRAGAARKRMRPAAVDGTTASASSAGEVTAPVGSGQLSAAVTAGATEDAAAGATGVDEAVGFSGSGRGGDGDAYLTDGDRRGREGRADTRHGGRGTGALTGPGTAQREEEGEVISPEAEQAATAFLLSFLTQMDAGGTCPGQSALPSSQGPHTQQVQQAPQTLGPPASLHGQGTEGRARTTDTGQQQLLQPPQPQVQRGPPNAGTTGPQQQTLLRPPQLSLPSDDDAALLPNTHSGMLAPSPGSGASARRAAAARTTAAVQRLRRKPSLGTDTPLQPPTTEQQQHDEDVVIVTTAAAVASGAGMSSLPTAGPSAAMAPSAASSQPRPHPSQGGDVQQHPHPQQASRSRHTHAPIPPASASLPPSSLPASVAHQEAVNAPVAPLAAAAGAAPAVPSPVAVGGGGGITQEAGARAAAAFPSRSAGRAGPSLGRGAVGTTAPLATAAAAQAASGSAALGVGGAGLPPPVTAAAAANSLSDDVLLGAVATPPSSPSRGAPRTTQPPATAPNTDSVGPVPPPGSAMMNPAPAARLGPSGPRSAFMHGPRPLPQSQPHTEIWSRQQGAAVPPPLNMTTPSPPLLAAAPGLVQLPLQQEAARMQAEATVRQSIEQSIAAAVSGGMAVTTGGQGAPMQGAAAPDMMNAPSRLLPHTGQPALPQWPSQMNLMHPGMGLGMPPGLSRPIGGPQTAPARPHGPPQSALGAHHPHGHQLFNPSALRPAFPAGGAGLHGGMGWGEGGPVGGGLPAAAPSPPPMSLIEIDVLVRKELALIKHRILQEILAENTAEYYECCTMHSRLRQLSMPQLHQGAAATNLSVATAPAAGPAGWGQQGIATAPSQHQGAAWPVLGERSGAAAAPPPQPHPYQQHSHHQQQQQAQQQQQQNVTVPVPSVMQRGPALQQQRGSASGQRQQQQAGLPGHVPLQPFPQHGGPAALGMPPLQQQQPQMASTVQTHHHQHQPSPVLLPTQNPLTQPPQGQQQPPPHPQSQGLTHLHNTPLSDLPPPSHARSATLPICQSTTWQSVPSAPSQPALAPPLHNNAAHAATPPTSNAEGSRVLSGAEGAPRHNSAQQAQVATRMAPHPHQTTLAPSPQEQLPRHHHQQQGRNEHRAPPTSTAQPHDPSAQTHQSPPQRHMGATAPPNPVLANGMTLPPSHTQTNPDSHNVGGNTAVATMQHEPRDTTATAAAEISRLPQVTCGLVGGLPSTQANTEQRAVEPPTYSATQTQPPPEAVRESARCRAAGTAPPSSQTVAHSLHQDTGGGVAEGPGGGGGPSGKKASHTNSTPAPSTQRHTQDLLARAAAGAGPRLSGAPDSRGEGVQDGGAVPRSRWGVAGGGVQAASHTATGAPLSMTGSAGHRSDGANAGADCDVGGARATLVQGKVRTPWDVGGADGPSTLAQQPGASTQAAQTPLSNATDITTSGRTGTGSRDAVSGNGGAANGVDGNGDHPGQGTNPGAGESAAAPFAGLSFKLQAPGLGARRVVSKRVVNTGGGSGSGGGGAAAASAVAGNGSDAVRLGAPSDTAAGRQGSPRVVRPVAAVGSGSIAPPRRPSPAVSSALGTSSSSAPPASASAQPPAAVPIAASVASPNKPHAAMQPPPQVLLSTAAAAGNGGQQDASTFRPQAQAAPVPGSGGSGSSVGPRHPHLTTAAAGSLTQQALHVQAMTAASWGGVGMQHSVPTAAQSTQHPDTGFLANHHPENTATFTEACRMQEHYGQQHQQQVQLQLYLQQVETQLQQQVEQQQQAQLQQNRLETQEEPSAPSHSARQQHGASSSQPRHSTTSPTRPGDSPSVPPPLYLRQGFVITAASSAQGLAASEAAVGILSSRYASPLRIFRTYSGSL